MNLTILSLYNNNISDISDLENLLNLQELYLDWNNITDISSLANLVNLTWLGIANNQIENINVIENLVNLQELDLYNNQIVDVSPLVNNSGIGSRDVVYLFNNPSLNNDSCTIYIPELESRGVNIISDSPEPTAGYANSGIAEKD